MEGQGVVLILTSSSGHLGLPKQKCLKQAMNFAEQTTQSSLKFLSGRCLCLCQSLTADDIAGARPESVPHSLAQIASVNVETWEFLKVPASKPAPRWGS